MALPRFHVTYEIVTPESAEDGEAADHGYVTPGEWHYPVNGCDRAADEDYSMRLREALGLFGPVDDVGRWFAESDGRVDYLNGSTETRALHPPANITPASYRRLARLLGCC